MLGCWWSRPYSRYGGDVFDPLGEFGELRCAGRGMPFNPPSLGPAIGGIVVPDITE
jgi:hypothetical protein